MTGMQPSASPILSGLTYLQNIGRFESFRGRPERVGSDLSGDRLAKLQRVLQLEREKRDFWARCVVLPAFALELDELLAALDAKAAR